MIQQEDILKLGEIFSKRIIQVDCVEYDKFMPNHEVEFRLTILDRAYTIKAKPINLEEPQANQIWMELFSTFLADYNMGLNKKEKLTANP